MRCGPRSDRTTTNYLGFDGRILAGAILARTLWLQGYPDRAVERALLTVEDAEVLNHPLTLSIALRVPLGRRPGARRGTHRSSFLACRISFPWTLSRARARLQRGARHSSRQRKQRCRKPAILSRRASCRPYELLTTPLNISFVQGLAATGRSAEALSLIEETIQQVERGGDLCYMAELLRVKGNLVLAAPQAGTDEEAELCFRRSLDLSDRQGARAWELRSAIDLAFLLAARGRHDAAQALLQPIFARFGEGLETADLQSAARLLATPNSMALAALRAGKAVPAPRDRHHREGGH
ncbi:hypothetical protein [Mesorhizobium sp. M1B.F.Ca.ET.045.04.1.1]|uniref:hypothetical protein n=1 Tax=Mesorhizobium sp. M1B.F.Ca.ET.045.04.1.1 TaxID=2493673 RepID=UPI000F75B690|nr:hypothetical protein [Mesorhizobium sp. M1B.F.Ca.ET.045.04.1.1]AZO28549.1 hypothetical protein EJ071_14880 [Mesorhizobium sp. M1B.F.Ca.ET.045.04.1.1]